MSRPLVIYHAACPDGFASAWCAWRRFGDGADYLPAHYGQSPPDVTGRDVYVLDFSFKRPVLETMVAACKTMALRDHHATARDDLEPVDAWPTACDFLFDMAHSGARLAWDYFWPGGDRPWLIDAVEDSDLWRFALPFSKEIRAVVASYPMSFDLWSDLAEAIENDPTDLRKLRR